MRTTFLGYCESIHISIRAPEETVAVVAAWSYVSLWCFCLAVIQWIQLFVASVVNKEETVPSFTSSEYEQNW